MTREVRETELTIRIVALSGRYVRVIAWPPVQVPTKRVSIIFVYLYDVDSQLCLCAATARVAIMRRPCRLPPRSSLALALAQAHVEARSAATASRAFSRSRRGGERVVHRRPSRRSRRRDSGWEGVVEWALLVEQHVVRRALKGAIGEDTRVIRLEEPVEGDDGASTLGVAVGPAVVRGVRGYLMPPVARCVDYFPRLCRASHSSDF